MTELIVERTAPAVVTVPLNRPERLNAVTPEMLARMKEAWRQADADPECRAIIVTGAASNFSSSMDLRGVADERRRNADAGTATDSSYDRNLAYRALLKAYRPAKPVVAAVEGVAIGGGTELLLGTDVRVAGEGARSGLSEARWGMYPAAGSAVRLPRQIPYTLACELMLTGKHIGAAEALRMGLVGSVVPAGGALAVARDLADRIAANGPLAVQAILRTLRETRSLSEADAFDFLAHPALHGEGEPFANYGTMDQRAEPRWAKANIAAFGGDPAHVAIAGQSAGSVDVYANVISPAAAAGLFTAAIFQSAPTAGFVPLADALARGSAFATAAGCAGTDATAADCLRRLSVPRILQLQ